MNHLVPILDDGVTLDYGDYVIVVLDAAAVPAAMPTGLADAVEQLLDKLGIPARDVQQQQGPTQEANRG